jgi:dihydrofolate reductase
MGRIVVSTNVTLDGISQDPTGDEGFELGGWFLEITESDLGAWRAAVHEEALQASALLLGGRTYEWFARRWVGRQGAAADRLAELPKHVVRSRDGRSDWGPTTVLTGDLAKAVAELKEGVSGDILVYASYELVHTLLDSALVDEVRLFVFPRALGSGGRLFRDLGRAVPLHLTEVTRLGDELVRLSYECVVAGEGFEPSKA